MKIVAADAMARALSEKEVRALLEERIVMHLGMAESTGSPVVNPVWYVFEDEVFRIVVGKTSHKATVLRANPRAYFSVDRGSAIGEARGVRGRARVRVIDDDVDLTVAVSRKVLRKYTGTDAGGYADDMLKAAREGGMSVLELTPSQFRAFSY